MRVSQLHSGQVTLPQQHPRAGEPYPIYSYLIEHPAGPILVDTGIGPGHEWIDEHFAPQDISVVAALADRGVEPGDVSMIINTHLHFDHTGRNREFPGVPVVAQLADRLAAEEPGFTVPEWLGFDGFVWQIVEGDVDVAHGVSVMLTPSHTPGHQAVVVATSGSPIVIAGQAVQDAGELEVEASVEDLPRTGAASFGEVARAIKALHPVAVWFSHSAQPWRPGNA